MIQKRRHIFKFLVVIGIIITIYLIASGADIVKYYLANPESLKQLILGLGILAPIGIIFLQFFQTTLSIIPSQVTTIVAGFVFGPIFGSLYSLIGAFFGSMFIFLVARKYGKKLALKFFEKKDLVHFNMLFKQKKGWALFLARIAPLFPNDLVSFSAGLTSLRLRDFNLFSSMGFVIQMAILTYFGSELASGKINFSLIAISLVVSALFLIALFESKIKKIVIKEIHVLGSEEHKIEKEFKKI